MPLLNDTFKALLKEGQFTKEILGAGATQIRNASYASKGVYFQAFTSLSTGLERIGKLCLMLDHYLDHGGAFPDLSYMKTTIGHKITLIYDRSRAVVLRRSIVLEYTKDLSDPIHRSILKVLSDFAEGDRYSNIDFIVGGPHSDPVASWFREVDTPLFEGRVRAKTKEKILHNAAAVAAMVGPHSKVLHSSETGTEITDLEDASYRSGMQEAVAPHRQLNVLQVIRYWVEILSDLEFKAMKLRRDDIPFFTEIFAAFYNPDSYLRTRKIWDRF